MPGTVVVHILPEVEYVLAEFVCVGIAVKKRVAIIAGQRKILRRRAQIGIGLRSRKRCIPILQRNLRAQKLRIRIRLRAPRKQILAAVAMLIRLVLALRAVAQIRKRVARKNGHRAADIHGSGDRQRENTGTDPFSNAGFHLSNSFRFDLFTHAHPQERIKRFPFS